ncbi:hypothetical protein Csp1_26790 [Corynebacterium provencense]|uniref:Uncharacterized protein n=1 Tax=Corynebacterium provencense TaxID=1737425 RepID=A0A2Z3YR15_9CORY|nr:hypothetical protein [Corynebacterium provencense]AWT27422.1 hypothetical protein Csp1_26790 [Corynebacterium provencense]
MHQLRQQAGSLLDDLGVVAGSCGNTTLKDVTDWLTPEVFARIVELGEQVTGDLGKRSTSRAALRARSKAPAFNCVIPTE